MPVEWKVIVGLGNPGARYARSRHNVGFQCVDALAGAHGLTFSMEPRLHAQIAQGTIAGAPVLLVKPMTYMNLSGKAVQAVLHYYRRTPADLLVVYDDLDLPLGRVRMRPAGGSGGHKGMHSIIQALGTEGFARLRIGIGRPSAGDPADYVLQDFTTDEAIEVARAIDRALEAIRLWLKGNLDAAMNHVNRPVEGQRIERS